MSYFRRSKIVHGSRDSFKELLWVAVARYKNHDPTRKRGRSPEELCCTMFDWGLELLPRTELQKVIGNTSADKRIKKYCEEVETTPPWDIEPENFVSIKKEGKEDINDKAEASTRTKEMENRLAAIERQVKTSLESLLDKMEKRMASTDEKVDKLEKSTTSLAMIVDKLAEKVG